MIIALMYKSMRSTTYIQNEEKWQYIEVPRHVSCLPPCIFIMWDIEINGNVYRYYLKFWSIRCIPNFVIYKLGILLQISSFVAIIPYAYVILCGYCWLAHVATMKSFNFVFSYALPTFSWIIKMKKKQSNIFSPFTSVGIQSICLENLYLVPTKR